MSKKDDTTTNITINNSHQSGGTFIGQQNVHHHAPPARNLDGIEVPRMTVAQLQARPVLALHVSGRYGNEPMALAQTLHNLASDLGWHVPSPPAMVMSPDPLLGVAIYSVGTDAADPLCVLAAWLNSVGVRTEYFGGRSANSIQVGENTE